MRKYVLRFYDQTGNKEVYTVGRYENVEGALGHAATYGAKTFWWDGAVLAGNDTIDFMGDIGTFAVYDTVRFDSIFGGKR